MGGTPPRLQSTTDLWAVLFAFSTFAGLAFCAPLAGKFAEGEEGNRLLAQLVVGGFFGALATAIAVSSLSEMVRRGAWVPPGTARHTVLVAIMLVAPIMAAVVALMLSGLWVLRLLRL
jgi:hypothetical protein